MSQLQHNPNAQHPVSRSLGTGSAAAHSGHLLYYFTPEVGGAIRVWLWGMNTLAREEENQLSCLQEVLNKVCYSGGPDKQEYKEFRPTMMSWELPNDVAEGTKLVVVAFLKRLQGVKVEESFRCW